MSGMLVNEDTSALICKPQMDDNYIRSFFNQAGIPLLPSTQITNAMRSLVGLIERETSSRNRAFVDSSLENYTKQCLQELASYPYKNLSQVIQEKRYIITGGILP